jgi:hypothetical protein
MAKPRNKEALDIIDKCRRLDLVIEELSGGVLVHVPLWADFKRKLDPSVDESVRVRDFRSVCNFFERISNKKAPAGHGRWFLWETGSFGAWGRATNKGFVRRTDRRPVGEKW